MLGALSHYVCTPNADFQPMNANFGVLTPLEKRIKGKKERYEAMSERALTVLDKILETL